MNGRLPRAQWPARLQRSWAVKGVFVGGCVSRGVGSSFRAKAHAHTDGPDTGWICVRAARRLTDEALMIHELAHLVTGDGHTDRWRRAVVRLGGTLEKTDSLQAYHRRKRPTLERKEAQL